MNIPSLPTDNLYKFMALSGIFIAVFGYSVYWIQGGRTQEIVEELSGLETRLEVIIKSPIVTGDSSIDTEKDLEAIAKVMQLTKEFDNLQKERVVYRNFSIFCLVVGSILSISGFSLWYFRVQKFQDMLLRKEALSVINEQEE